MPQQFDADVLNDATDKEMEHTSDRAEAQKIAMDHLREDPFYYQHLSQVTKTDLSPTPNYPPTGSAADPFGVVKEENSPDEKPVTMDPRHPDYNTKLSKSKPKPPVVKDEWNPELEKARVTGRVHVELPIGAVKDGRVKVKHKEDGTTGWVSVRAGQALSNDGHAISSLNPNGK